MVQIALIGIAAGAASALLFASVASGSPLSLILFYLAPLPVLIAALGWSHMAGLIAALFAAASLAVVLGGTYFFLTFLIGIGLPAWWLGYLALLARPVAAPGGETLEWYPVGRIVVWAALIAALVVVIAIPNFGTDAETFRTALRRAFERLLRVQAEKPVPGAGPRDIDRLLDLLVLLIPPAAAALSTLTSVLNLWLAGRIVKVSGRLKRPWPDLPSMTFPRFAPAVLALAVAATFLAGLIPVVAGIVTSSLLMAYSLLGLAVLHAVTRGAGARPLILGGVYAVILLQGWTLLLVALIGLVDTILDIRRRMGRGPPAAPA